MGHAIGKAATGTRGVRGLVVLVWIMAGSALCGFAQTSSTQASFVQSAVEAAAKTSPSTNSHKRVVLVSIADRKLAVIDDGIVVARFSVAVGAEVSPSPVGEFQIVSRVANPTYYHPGTVIPSGKDNPVGTRWVGLSRKGYGIHGTNVPRSVGHAASHGCIRLRNRDMERLFKMVRTGDVVQIRGERDEQVAQIFGSGADDAALADAQVVAQGVAGQGDAGQDIAGQKLGQ